MRHIFLFLFIPVFFVTCANRPRLPTEIEIVPNEPSVANDIDDFSFEIGAEHFYFIDTYSLEFNSNIVTLFVTVKNYSDGTGTLVLNGVGNSLIFSHSLSENQDEEFRLSGNNIPQKIQLEFNNYRGRVSIRLEPEPL